MRVKLNFGQRVAQAMDDHNKSFRQIAKEMGVTEPQLRNLQDNSKPHISREVLEMALQWVCKVDDVSPSKAIADMIVAEEGGFWQMAAERNHVEILTGMRPSTTQGDHLIVLADSMMQSIITSILSEKQCKKIDEQSVPTWDATLSNQDEVVKAARNHFKRFEQPNAKRGLLCIGSVKSNPVIELVVARGFLGAEPFQSQDDCDDESERSCPFYYMYREDDVQVPSCCGGRQLSKSSTSAQPGIYYQKSPGEWACAPWVANERDAALVYYRFNHHRGRLEMVLGGFSGRGTHCLAQYLTTNHEALWPPNHRKDPLDVGAFVVEFQLKASKDDGVYYQTAKNLRVNAVDSTVLADRVTPPSTK